MNHITKHSGARGVPSPLEMMRLLLEDDVKRCDGRRVESTRCTDACPPRMRMMLARLLNRVRDGGFRIDSAAADTFRFYPAYTPPGQGRRPRNWFHLVRCDGQPSEWTCACGLKKVTGFPCECLAAVAVQKKGVPDIAQLVDSEYTTAVWQAQYNFNFAATLPGSVPHGPPSRLKLPSFQPTRAGPSGAASCLQAREGRAGRGGEQWHTLATTRMLLRPPQPSPQLPAPTTQGRWRTHQPCQLHLARLGSTVAAGARRPGQEGLRVQKPTSDFQVSNRDECVMSSNLQGGLCDE